MLNPIAPSVLPETPLLYPRMCCSEGTNSQELAHSEALALWNKLLSRRNPGAVAVWLCALAAFSNLAHPEPVFPAYSLSFRGMHLNL